MMRTLRWRASTPSSTDAVDLERAFELCSEITRDHSKSFYFSSSFLPAEKRRAIRAFYAFCRSTDDMVDVLCQTESEARIALEAWRRSSRQSADEQGNPVLAAWTFIRDLYAVPQQYVEELIDGCGTDLTVKRYETWDQLAQYCYCVASTVGLITMQVVGVVDHAAATVEGSRRAAINLGIALQLTNILRDIGEDLGRGRIYIPQEDLHRFGTTEDDLRAGVIDDRFRALMRFQIDRANALYDASLPAIASLKRDGRVAVGAAALLYRGILGKIVENDFDVFNRRAHLSFQDKVGRMPGIVWTVRGLKLEP